MAATRVSPTSEGRADTAPVEPPRADSVGVVVALTVAGLLITLGAAFVLSQDDDVSLWWWIPIGLALLLGLGGVAATTTSVWRRRTRVRDVEPGDEAGEHVVKEGDCPPQSWERRFEEVVDRRCQRLEDRLEGIKRLEERLATVERLEARQAVVEHFENRLKRVEGFEARLNTIEGQLPPPEGAQAAGS